MASLLFNPATYDPTYLDDESRRQLLALVQYFEAKGHAQLKDDFHGAQWYSDFVQFIADEGIFARFGTPTAVAELLPDSAADARWDTARINDLNEILGFYGLDYWYAWQVTVLGLGPVWTSDNEQAKALVAQLLRGGGIFGFGLSEQNHGADIYSTDLVLTSDGAGGWTATGAKYYIGNGNVGARISVFGRFADDDPDRPGEYVFFLADPERPEYVLEKNVVHGQMYVSAFRLEDYAVDAVDILHTGKAAWDAALATINVGKVNLGWASIGICEHAFFEAIAHAHNRILYGNPVTDFPHVRRMLGDAYARMIGMKLYSVRSADYFRSASPDDRRFLLFNPITKMKVTMEGEKTIDLLWDVIAARGFEKDTYFEQAVGHIRALPKLEGTVHVNLALVLKFLPQYLAAAVGYGEQYGPIGPRNEAADDDYLFAQGSASGLSKIPFHDPRPAFARFAHLPNVAAFIEQMHAFAQLVSTAPPSKEQAADLDLLLTLGQLFTQIVYAQLTCESAALALDDVAGGKRESSVSDCSDLTEAHLDRVFAVFIRDFNDYAVSLYSQAAASDSQREQAIGLIRQPTTDAQAEAAFVAEVIAHDGAFVMNP
ncbi:MAG: acyl-CoA dehydrogenase family protein [Actinomycetes bacterium]